MVFKALRCWNCGKKIKKHYKYCPYCGVELKRDEKGEEHIKRDKQSGKIPLELKLAQKLAEKILGKEFVQQLDKAITKAITISISNDEQAGTPRINIKTFPLTDFEAMKHKESNNIGRQVKTQKTHTDIEKLKEKAEQVLQPKTKVRRLGDSVIYELAVPESEKTKLVINQEPNRVEIAIPFKAKNKTSNLASKLRANPKGIYLKTIPLPLEFKTYRFEDDRLIIEFKA